MSYGSGMMQCMAPAKEYGPWTGERDAQLYKMWAEGMTTLAMADALNTTKNSIISRARRIGCQPRMSPIIVTGARPHIRQPSSKRKHVAAPPLPTLLELMALPEEQDAPLDSPLAHQAREVPALYAVTSARPCQWPMWKGRTPKQPLFCGAPVRIRADGLPCWTCVEHAKIAFTTPSPTRIDFTLRTLGTAA